MAARSSLSASEGVTAPPKAEERLSILVTNLLQRSRTIVLPRPPEPAWSKAGELRVTHSEATEPEPKEYPSKSVLRQTLEQQRLWDVPNEVMHELHVFEGECLHKFTGVEAFNRLSVVTPTAFQKQVLAVSVRPRTITYKVSLVALSRSCAGSQQGTRDLRTWQRLLAGKHFVPNFDAPGVAKNRRFYECAHRVHGFLSLAQQAYPEEESFFGNMNVILVNSMFIAAMNRSKTVQLFMDAVEAIMREPHTALERLIKSKAKDIQVVLYRLRRDFAKDDNDPLENCLNTIKNFTAAPKPWGEMKARVDAFAERFRLWLSKTDVTGILNRVCIHGSGASLFHTRKNGGGSADLHLIVGLFRLSQGRSSALTNVFGAIRDDVTPEELIDRVSSRHVKDEVFEACAWFLREHSERFITLVMSIYPEREAKARTFFLFDFATQLGASIAAAVLREYLKTTDHCREVFLGFETGVILDHLERAPEGCHVMSLDSMTSTDPIPHDLALAVYDPCLDLLPPFVKLSVQRIFGPRRIAGSLERPKQLPIGSDPSLMLLRHLSIELSHRALTSEELPMYKGGFWVGSSESPPVAIASRLKDLVDMLVANRAVLLKARTGSGKTVLAAASFSAIIQFPSIASMFIFSRTCTHFGIRHNVYYSRQKVITNFHDEAKTIPCTILTTSSYVVPLGRRYRKSVVVLDEAESRIEDFVCNLAQRHRIRNRLLIMSATPESLRLGPIPTLVCDETTHHHVEDRKATEEDMVAICREQKTKNLIIAFSEPECQRLAKAIGPSAGVLNAYARSTGLLEEVCSKNTIISTNVVRSSVTLPDLDIVFDQGLFYEMVDSPVQGFENLVLFCVSDSMRTQARGRVGRTKGGLYYRVDARRRGSEFSPQILSCLPKLNQLLSRIGVSRLATDVNFASFIVEACSQTIGKQLLGADCKLRPGSPHSLQVAAHFVSNVLSRRFSRFVAFQVQGLHARMTTLRYGGDVERKIFDDYRKWANTDLLQRHDDLLNTLRERGLFSQEIFLIDSWTSDLSDERVTPLELEATQIGLTHAFWKSVYSSVRGTMTSVFRSCQLGARFREPDGFHVLFGVNMDLKGTLSYVCSIPVSATAVRSLKNTIGEISLLQHPFPDPIDRTVYSFSRGVADIPGRQAHELTLVRDGGARDVVFEPRELDSILLHLEGLNRKCVRTPIFTSARGSPQSSAASFPLLNALSMITAEEKGTRSWGFGDDLLTFSSMQEQLEAIIYRRETVSLMTKWPSTGMARVGDDALAVYTERFFDLKNRVEITAPKSRGIVNLYSALKPGQLCLAKNGEYAALVGVHRAIESSGDPFAAVLGPLKEEKRFLSRSTGPRSLIHSMLEKLPKVEGHYLVAGKTLDIMVKQLESMLLTIYPSTKGAPVEREIKAPRLHVTVESARAIAKSLEKIRCHLGSDGDRSRFEPLRLDIDGVWSERLRSDTHSL